VSCTPFFTPNYKTGILRGENMAYIPNRIGFGLGEIVVTAKRVECLAGYFEEGTKVEIIGVSERGYDLQDEYGNRIIETGFDSVKRI
jgi:hypothetical protein